MNNMINITKVCYIKKVLNILRKRIASFQKFKVNDMFLPTWVSPPGDTIRDILNTKNSSVKKFAETIGMSLSQTYDLLDGLIEITPAFALRLEKLLGGTAEFWMNRERQYRKSLDKTVKS